MIFDARKDLKVFADRRVFISRRGVEYDVTDPPQIVAEMWERYIGLQSEVAELYAEMGDLQKRLEAGEGVEKIGERVKAIGADMSDRARRAMLAGHQIIVTACAINGQTVTEAELQNDLGRAEVQQLISLAVGRDEDAKKN